MALWKARSLTPEEKIQLVEEESDTEDLQNEESASFLEIEDAKMSEIFKSTKHLDVRFLIPSDFDVQSTMSSMTSAAITTLSSNQTNFYFSFRCQHSWGYLRVVLWSVK
jgi:hypothetical protein